MKKVCFSLREKTVKRLDDLATRRKAAGERGNKSEIVDTAINKYLQGLKK